MSIDTANLPNDVTALQAMVLARAVELKEIGALRVRLARLLRMTFGRASEKLRGQVE